MPPSFGDTRGPARDKLSEAFEQAVSWHQRGEFAEARRLYRLVLRKNPKHFDALHLSGVLEAQRGRPEKAAALIQDALRIQSNSAEAHANLGNVQRQLGQLPQALASYDRALAFNPLYPNALNGRGLTLADLDKLEDALASYDKALSIDPNFAAALYNCGMALRRLDRLAEALASFERALAADSHYAPAHVGRGIVLSMLGRMDEALAAYDQALRIQADSVEALYNRGVALFQVKRFDEALTDFGRALEIDPGFHDALHNRGTALLQMRRFDEALGDFDRLLALDADAGGVLLNRGTALLELGRHDEALTSFERALALEPRSAAALKNRGGALLRLRRFEEALANFDRALTIQPEFPEALNDRGNALAELGRLDEALAAFDAALDVDPHFFDALANRGSAALAARRFEIAVESFERLLAISPDFPYLAGKLLFARMHCCDWAQFEDLKDRIERELRTGQRVVTPFHLLAFCDGPEDQLRAARIWVEDMCPPRPPVKRSARSARHDRIKLGYLSADFHAHATAFLMAELFERHDRGRFETIAVSFGPDDGSEMRRRLEAAFDRFADVKTDSDQAIAGFVRDNEIDILVDLKGFTGNARTGILAQRPAGIQVGYLGYPGTMAADYIDYIIADRLLIPPELQGSYAERVVYLPDSYQVNDSKRRIAEVTSSKADAGLPADGFVFCCFNNAFKITPDIFSVWMSLLRSVEGSVLWLMEPNPSGADNLRCHANSQGVAPQRLVFARPVPLADHLARHRLADLFLDTLPYNAHTTASDALWAGLPVLTCQGHSFAGRVAASLLNAVGLPQMITATLADYEALALRLARAPDVLGSIRAELSRDRLTCPLFDCDRFRRHIEAAFTTMWERHQGGEPPCSFAVDPVEAAR